MSAEQRRQPPNQAEALKPQEFAPNAEGTTSDISQRIDEALQQAEGEVFWSCNNGPAYGGHCGCCYGHNGPTPSHTVAPGASRSNPVFYSKRKSDWNCNPVLVLVKAGRIIGYAPPGAKAP